MKNRAYTVIIIFCLLFAVFMTSCKKDGTPSETDTERVTDAETILSPETTAPITETLPAETTAPETIPDDDQRTPVENEKAVKFIEYQFDKAMEAVDWAENGALSADLSIEISDDDGNSYFPIKDTEKRPELEGASITSFADLSKYINSIFARSLADDLIDLAKKHYKDIDGVLCLKAKFTDTEPKIDIPEEDTDNGEISEADKNEPKVLSTEFFLSYFSETYFRYTAKVSYENRVSDSEEDILDKSEENAEYFDFIFENTGGGWYWTVFPKLPK